MRKPPGRSRTSTDVPEQVNSETSAHAVTLAADGLINLPT
jgi:hypothetical protein